MSAVLEKLQSLEHPQVTQLRKDLARLEQENKELQMKVDKLKDST